MVHQNKSKLISNNAQKAKELLSLLLKKCLDNRLITLEQKSNNEKNNLRTMLEVSNNMISFLEQSTKKIGINHYDNNNINDNDINRIKSWKSGDIIQKNFCKTITNFYNGNKDKEKNEIKEKNEVNDNNEIKHRNKHKNKNKDNDLNITSIDKSLTQVRPSIENSPIRVKRLNSKNKSFIRKIKNKKIILNTPINENSGNKIGLKIEKKDNISKFTNFKSKFSNFKKKLSLENTENNSIIINNIKENNGNGYYKKKKIIIHFRQNNGSRKLMTKQNSFLSNKKNKSIDNKNKNKNHKNFRAVTPLILRKKNMKKYQISFQKSSKIHTSKKIKAIYKENKSKSKKTTNLYKKHKTKTYLDGNRDNIDNIKKELDILCENNYLENDIRLNELKIEENEQVKNLLPQTPMCDNTQRKLSFLSQSLLKMTIKDDLLVSKRNSILNSGIFSIKISLEESLESCIEYISEYLSINDLFNLGLINKEFFKIVIRFLINKTEEKVEKLKDKINELIKGSNNLNINNKELNQFEFECHINSTRAIILLNSISINKLFKSNSPLMDNKDIIFILELFFIAIGKKKDILKYYNNENNNKKNNNNRWNYICKYFKENENKFLGNIIEKEIFNRKYNDEIINSLYEWSYKNIDKITPNYYQKINKDIAIFVFIIRDLLESFGITQEKKANSQKLFILYNIRQNVQEKIIENLNQLLSKIK